MKNWIMTAVCVAGVMTTVPAQAQITESLAKQCREMMIKAHPTQLYGPTGTAALQRDYFQQCIKRQGKMDQGKMDSDSEPTTTGSGAGQR
jgi:hypothetical protein